MRVWSSRKNEEDGSNDDRKPPPRTTEQQQSRYKKRPRNNNESLLSMSPRNHEDDPAQHDDDQEERDLEAALLRRGLEIVPQQGDGNCLFRSVALQVYGDANMHEEVRAACVDHIARDPSHFAQFVDQEPFEEYIQRKRQEGVHGNNLEIQAISEIFNRPVQVYQPALNHNGAPMNIFQTNYKTADEPIRLSYHRQSHYNAVIDPLKPTAGLGLGLPGLKPGLADHLQLGQAKMESDQLEDERQYEIVLKESEQNELQRAINESNDSVEQMYRQQALALSDLDATNFELEQAVLQSSLEDVRSTTQKPTPQSNVAAILPPQNEEEEEYPPIVQELVMNGFALEQVIHAYELVGDDFNDLLALLLSMSKKDS